MILVAPIDRARSRPFRILDGESEHGARLGGRAPDGIGDDVLDDSATYVLTIPLATAPDLELSVFVRGELWDTMNRGVITDPRITCLVHAPSRRRTDRRFASPLSEHRIVVGEDVDDVELVGAPGDADARPRADHKLGGRPFCIQEPELGGAEALLDAGWTQLLQLDFPSSRDGDISGSWPFADGMFNLFGAPPFRQFAWAFQK